MPAQRPEYPSANASERPASGVFPDAVHGAMDELAELSIEELEPRLTPDGWEWPGSQSRPSNSPTGQVGWGC